jgi:hypothetical protein
LPNIPPAGAMQVLKVLTFKFLTYILSLEKLPDLISSAMVDESTRVIRKIFYLTELPYTNNITWTYKSVITQMPSANKVSV